MRLPGVETGAAADPEQVVLDAIANRLCLMADYNRGAVILQPVLLFREHDAAFLIADTVSRDGKPPREPKLGTFRVSGLGNIRRLRTAIDPAVTVPVDWQGGRPTRELVASIGASPRADAVE